MVWSCQAAIEFESRGVPTVVIATDVFEALAKEYLRAGGHMYVPVITTENPIVYLEPKELRERAAALSYEVMCGFTIGG